MSPVRILALLGLAILIALPAVTPPYFLHLLIQILIWSFIYTAWALMGRFGFVSFGHGAFMGVGAYVPALLWSYYDVTPWMGIPLGVGLSALLALIIGYPCFRLRVVGHYFALVTLALSQVVLLSLTAAREITGGSLGFTPKAAGHSWYALQFPEKSYFLCHRARTLACRTLRLAADRPRHQPRGAGGDFRGRGRRRRAWH
jgi:branched-chain amino acid transport system permease protein